MENSYKTRGIILHSLRHGDAGTIVYIYTEKYARQTYYIRGGRNGKPLLGKQRISLQPLTAIEFVGAPSRSGGMHYIREARRTIVTPNILFDVRKASVALFVSEVCYRIIREEEPNPYLFDFLHNSIGILERLESGISNFHLYFFVHLARFLGFYPGDNYRPDFFFDIKRGEYVMFRPTHDKYFSAQQSALLETLRNTAPDKLDEIKLNRNQRVEMIDKLILYYGYHHDTEYKIESVKILSEIF